MDFIEILKIFFSFIFNIQVKMLNNIFLFNKLKKFNILYFILSAILFYLLDKEKIELNRGIILITIIGILAFISNSVDIMTSARKLFQLYFFIFILFPTLILLFIFTNNFIFENLYYFIGYIVFYFLYLLLITSFVDGKVALLVNTIYTIISSLFFSGLKFYNFFNKNIFSKQLFENLEIIFIPLTCIFAIATILALIKEYWTYKYNKGIDVLVLLNEKNKL